MHRLQVSSTYLQSKIPSQQVHTLARHWQFAHQAKNNVGPVFYSPRFAWSPLLGDPTKGHQPWSARKKKERKKKRMGPVFYSSRKSGLPSWGNATERHQPYEVLEKKGFWSCILKPGEARGEGDERMYKRDFGWQRLIDHTVTKSSPYNLDLTMEDPSNTNT